MPIHAFKFPYKEKYFLFHPYIVAQKGGEGGRMWKGSPLCTDRGNAFDSSVRCLDAFTALIACIRSTPGRMDNQGKN